MHQIISGLRYPPFKLRQVGQVLIVEFAESHSYMQFCDRRLMFVAQLAAARPHSALRTSRWPLRRGAIKSSCRARKSKEKLLTGDHLVDGLMVTTTCGDLAARSGRFSSLLKIRMTVTRRVTERLYSLLFGGG